MSHAPRRGRFISRDASLAPRTLSHATPRLWRRRLFSRGAPDVTVILFRPICSVYGVRRLRQREGLCRQVALVTFYCRLRYSVLKLYVICNDSGGSRDNGCCSGYRYYADTSGRAAYLPCVPGERAGRTLDARRKQRGRLQMRRVWLAILTMPVVAAAVAVPTVGTAHAARSTAVATVR